MAETILGSGIEGSLASWKLELVGFTQFTMQHGASLNRQISIIRPIESCNKFSEGTKQ